MQIQNNKLIAECSSYDFKEMLERKKVKSWLKSVSAFANTNGGSLFYGVNDDGVIVGLENPQADTDFISEMIKARLDPVPEVQLIPIEHEGHTLLEVKVKAGTLTPYYYYQDGTRTAMPKGYNPTPILLGRRLNDDFDEKWMQKLTDICCFHKTTYRIKRGTLQNKNSFYSKIIEKYSGK